MAPRPYGLPSTISCVSNTNAPFICWSVSSILGKGNLSRCIALFAHRISTHKRIPLFDFGIGTKALTQGVGPYIFSITSRSSSSFNLLSTFSRILNGNFLAGCATGLTFSSTYNFN